MARVRTHVDRAYGLSIQEIVDAFPDEVMYMVPGIIQDIDDKLEDYKVNKAIRKNKALQYFTLDYAEKLGDEEMPKELIKHKNKMCACKNLLEGKKTGVTEEDISNAKEVSIQELYDSWVKPKFHSNRFIACCPFGHKDNTPSFTVSHRNLFKCFSCQKSGSSIDFIMELQGLDFIKAVKFILARN